MRAHTGLEVCARTAAGAGVEPLANPISRASARAQAARRDAMAVITISRPYGSGGDEIAVRVCEMLGYRYFDKRWMAQVAPEVGLNEGEIVDFSEDQHRPPSRARSYLGYFRDYYPDDLIGQRLIVAQARTWNEAGVGARNVDVVQLDEAASLNIMQAAVRAACKLGDIVIVGRGGQAILRDEPGVLHVRIEAPLEDRMQHVEDHEHVDRATARKMVASREMAGADYLKRFYAVDWSDPTLYHLVINASKLDVEAAAQLIVHAVGRLPSRGADEPPRAPSRDRDRPRAARRLRSLLRGPRDDRQSGP
jgi:cytidylate kinase